MPAILHHGTNSLHQCICENCASMKFVSFVSRSPTASVVGAPGAAEVALDARETAEICGTSDEINLTCGS